MKNGFEITKSDTAQDSVLLSNYGIIEKAEVKKIRFHELKLMPVYYYDKGLILRSYQKD